MQLRYQFLWNTEAPQIVVVEIDEASFKDIGLFPFSRNLYAQALDNLALYSPAVVAFDILFLDPSSRSGDKELQEALARNPYTVLGAARNQNGEILSPHAVLWKVDYGYLTPIINKRNNTVYSFIPQQLDSTSNISYEYFAIRIYRKFLEYVYRDDSWASMGTYTPSQYILWKNISIDLAERNSHEILMTFAPSRSFRKISFSDLLDLSKLHAIHEQQSLEDMIFIIWPAANGLKDDFFTPFGKEYGVYIHANIVKSLMQKDVLQYFPKILEIILISIFVFLSILIHLSLSYRGIFLSHILLIWMGLILLPLGAFFILWEIFRYNIEFLLAFILSFTLAHALKYMIESLHKTRLNSALSEYVSSSIAEEILGQHGNINLDGEEKKLVCYFSDIEGFTSMSERLSPSELVRFLRDYLSCMTEVIMSQWWHVDKFEGDAIMALWGAFSPLEKSSYFSALDTILEQKKNLLSLNEQWSTKLGANISFRTGLHAWNAILGNIGAIGKKMEFTALGDNINLASRLEWVNKYYGTYVCVSEEIYTITHSRFSFRYLDTIRVKGKDIPVRVYELLGRIWSVDLVLYHDYTQGIQLYQKRLFQEALVYFQKGIKAGDSVSKVYAQRCKLYIDNPPLKDWDGVWTMSEK